MLMPRDCYLDFGLKRAKLFLGLVIVCGNDLVIQHEVVVFFINFGQNVCERFVHHIHDLFPLKQFAILLNGEIAVKFAQNILRVWSRLDAHINFSVHCIQHLTPFKFYRSVNAFIHQIRQRAFRAAKTSIDHISIV